MKNKTKLGQGVAIASVLAVLAYGLFPNFRLGLELLDGYYLWALSFFLFLIASLPMLDKESLGDEHQRAAYRNKQVT